MTLSFSFYNIPLQVSKKGNETISLASSVFNIILKDEDCKVYQEKERGAMDRLTTVYEMVGHEDYLLRNIKIEKSKLN